MTDSYKDECFQDFDDDFEDFESEEEDEEDSYVNEKWNFTWLSSWNDN